MDKSSIIVVDIQNDFTTGSLGIDNYLEKPKSSSLIENVNKIIEQFPTKVFSRDWHPSNHISFISNYDLWKTSDIQAKDLVVGTAYSLMTLNKEIIQQKLWPAHCIEKTDGASLCNNLYVPKDSLIINKGVLSDVDVYSAFGYDNSPRGITKLHQELTQRNVKVNFICGLVTHICVEATCIDSVNLGYVTFLILDCTETFDKLLGDEAIRLLKERGVITTTTKKILERKGNFPQNVNELIEILKCD